MDAIETGNKTGILERLKTDGYVNDDNTLNVETLMERNMQTGKGSIADGDVYVLEQRESTASSVSSDTTSTLDYYLIYYTEEKDDINLGLAFDYQSGTSQSTAKTVVQAYKDGELKIGDYVNYQNPTSGEYISYANKNGVADQHFSVDQSTQWIVLGLSEDGEHLLLTTSSPIKRGLAENPYTKNRMTEKTTNAMNTDYYYYLYGAEGAYYATANEQGEGELDKICAIYKNDLADESRSMTAEDINNLLGLIVVEKDGYGGVFKKEDINHENNFTDSSYIGKKYQLNNKDQIPETALGLKEVSEIPQEYYNDGIKGTAYAYNYRNSNLEITNEMYSVFFKDAGQTKHYWLASEGITVGSFLAYWGIGEVFDAVDISGNLFYTDGDTGGTGNGVRPIVSIKSNITVEQLQKITGTEDESWPQPGDVWFTRPA